jgi:hypothetical protein
MGQIHDTGGPLRQHVIKIDIIEMPTQHGGEERLVSTTVLRNIASGVGEVLSRFKPGARRGPLPLKVKVTVLEGDPTALGDMILAFQVKRPTLPTDTS